MKKSIQKLVQGYHNFRTKYALGDASVMQGLSLHGQKPEIMIVACCDSRVDPALILQCDPGDLFVVRNVANIVPPYEKDEKHHGTSAALEFGIRFLQVKNLIIFGHSQCGGIETLCSGADDGKTDFIRNWVSIVQTHDAVLQADEYAKLALTTSYDNCLTFPWIKERIENEQLTVHRWFFDIKEGQIYTYMHHERTYRPL
jgi:carbonic anhydrase